MLFCQTLSHSRQLRYFGSIDLKMDLLRNCLASCILAFCLTAANVHAVVNFTNLVYFNGPNGANPSAGLVRATDGNFYGTTSSGGATNLGTVFQLTASGTLNTLISFAMTNGASPLTELVQGADSKLYGTTYGGGTYTFGTVFSVTTSGVLTNLVSFDGYTNGLPKGSLVRGTDGWFYGTTAIGGTNSLLGTAFRISTNGVLQQVCSFGADGASPYAGMVQGADGYLYGTTFSGGTYGHGTVFKLATNGTLLTLHPFAGGSDGDSPYAPLVQATDGNFYGTTQYGGTNAYGTVFRVSSSGAFSTLASFANTNGAHPQAGLIEGTDGCLYGMTAEGEVFTNQITTGCGTIFKVATNGVLTSLFSFDGTNGASPRAGLLQVSYGTFCGTTYGSGLKGSSVTYGTIFRITISAPPRPIFQSITRAGNSLVLTWSTVPGAQYQLESIGDLSQTNWSNSGSLLTADGAFLSATNSIGPAQRQFYRVLLRQ
jgi:uncharacterized repeat protein (TIGR03803 family)